jgi:hypothetical protein
MDDSRPKVTLGAAALIGGILLTTTLVYFWQLRAEQGSSYVSPDGAFYVALAQGSVFRPPVGNRVLKPYLAACLSSVMGLPTLQSFHALTLAELLGGLFCLLSALARGGASLHACAAALASLGLPMAVFYGAVPVLIDPTVFLFACLSLLCIEAAPFGVSLAVVCLSVSAKEYAIFLALPLACAEWCRGRRANAVAALAVPAGVLVLLMHRASAGAPGPVLQSATVPALSAFLNRLLTYHRSLATSGGVGAYLKTLYIWSWAVAWPVLLVTFADAVAAVRRPARTAAPDVYLLALVPSLPLLLLSDWDRSFLLIAPYAFFHQCIVRPHRRDGRFLAIVTAGCVATAFARPIYRVVAPPPWARVGFILLSLSATAMVVLELGRRLHEWWNRPRLASPPAAIESARP